MSCHDVKVSIGDLELDVDTAKTYLERCFPGEPIIFDDRNIDFPPKSYISVGVSKSGTVLFANKIDHLDLPDACIFNSDYAVAYFKREYPGIQIRFHGISCPEFPYPKRIPFIDLGIDGGGMVVGATMRDRAALPIKSLLLDLKTAEKYLKKCYPTTQLRYSGLLFRPFTVSCPYIDIGIDETGKVVFAQHRYS